MEFSYLADGNGKWFSCYAKYLVVPQKAKQRITIGPSSYTPGYKPQFFFLRILIIRHELGTNYSDYPRSQISATQ